MAYLTSCASVLAKYEMLLPPASTPRAAYFVYITIPRNKYDYFSYTKAIKLGFWKVIH